MSRSDPLGPLLEALEAIAPLRLAAAWDNVGLLIEPISLERAHRILLTIDLTPSVLEEAVAGPDAGRASMEAGAEGGPTWVRASRW